MSLNLDFRQVDILYSYINIGKMHYLFSKANSVIIMKVFREVFVRGNISVTRYLYVCVNNMFHTAVSISNYNNTRNCSHSNISKAF